MLHQDLQVSATCALSPELQQSLQVLEAPIDQLSQLIIQEVVANPIFDLSSIDVEVPASSSVTSETTFDSSIAEDISPIALLYRQAEIVFSSPEKRFIAQFIIGSLDEHGFLNTPVQEIAVLTDYNETLVIEVLDQVKTFSPVGVASKNLQEHWLLQLKNLQHPLIYRAVRDYYPLLLSCDFAKIAKKLSVPLEEFSSSLRKVFRQITWSPFANEQPSLFLHAPLPDVYLHKNNGQWMILINKKGLPELKIDMEILKIFRETKTHGWSKEISAAKHLLKSIKRREQTLTSLIEKILPIQESFLLGREAYPKPCCPKEIAEELGYHVSTIFRTIENKSVSCPIGIIPLKQLFPSKKSQLQTIEDASINSEKAKDAIREIIANEDIPLSDEDISEHLLKMGIVCARRTVSKYRKILQILPSNKRKQRLSQNM